MIEDRLEVAVDAPELRRSRQLPFTIQVATSEVDVAELVQVRSDAYSRHNAPGADKLKVAEKQDRGDDAVLLLARSKLDASVLGSVRIQTRLVNPLLVEAAMELPQDVASKRPIELMRGSVSAGTAGRMVSGALAKASFQICVALGFTHIIVTCREPVNALYRAYEFDELLGGEMIDLPYSPGAKHKVLCLPVQEAGDRWRSRNPVMLDFMMGTDHPDLQLDLALVRRRLAAAHSRIAEDQPI